MSVVWCNGHQEALDSFFECKTVFKNTSNFITTDFNIYFECNLDKKGSVRHKETITYGFMKTLEFFEVEKIFGSIKKDIDNYRNKLWC